MKTIVQDLATQYEDEGSGRVVLMLHGWKDTLHTFDALSRELKHTYRVVRLDLPGFGQSEISIQPWNVSAYVNFVNEFIRKLNLDVDTIIGHSLGGRIVIKGVGSGILKPRRIILISAAGLAKQRGSRNSVLGGVAKIGKVLTVIPPLSIWRNQLRRKLYEKIGSDYFTAGALKDTFVAVVREDLSAFAARISLPTLIIWGRNDTITPLEQGERINSLVAGSVLRVVDGATHFVQQEKPDRVSTLIKEFSI
ncbi:MAG: hydrolase [Parcubacteria group bacterium Gr01-1014_8]|nr:MAG: hydrolase [Parcubacteria group bacterium Gr01-1014_8]